MRIEPASHFQPAGSAPPPNEIRDALARRLTLETQGEVLFDDASRGRYATDASIYQIIPVGVLAPKTERDIATAIDVARDLKPRPAIACVSEARVNNCRHRKAQDFFGSCK